MASTEGSTERLKVLAYVCDGRIGARPELVAEILAGLDEGADVISAQGTGMDSGPHYLGAGETGAPPVRQTFETAILEAKKRKIPFVFSMGGRAGADVQLESYLDAIDEIARDNKTVIRAAVISGEVDKAYVLEQLGSGAKIPRLYDTPRLSEFLTEQDIEEARVIQTQMGPEPIMEALKLFDDGSIDGVFTGRALDSGVHMAYPLLRGLPIAGAAHLAKIVECGSMCCDPANAFHAVLAELRSNGDVTVKALAPESRCTVRSVAGHSLYERENPFEEKNPGGVLDVSGVKYEQQDERTVHAQGAHWEKVPYAIKLEGVKSLGYETSFILVTADPTLISNIPDLAERTKKAVFNFVHESGIAEPGTFQIVVHQIGLGSLPGVAETLVTPPSEISLLVQVVAPNPEISRRIAITMRVRLTLADYPGRTTTAGNFAMPLTNAFLDQGELYVYNIWHLLPLSDPTEPFPIRVVEFPRK